MCCFGARGNHDSEFVESGITIFDETTTADFHNPLTRYTESWLGRCFKTYPNVPVVSRCFPYTNVMFILPYSWYHIKFMIFSRSQYTIIFKCYNNSMDTGSVLVFFYNMKHFIIFFIKYNIVKCRYTSLHYCVFDV